MNIIAIIPARAGSKRVSGKNTKILGDKPLIAYSIETALSANCFSKVIVSTEDENIAAVARSYGAEVPWLRPSHLATDDALAIDVVLDVVNRLTVEKNKVDAVMLLQPTSPFRTVDTIQKALKLFSQNYQESVVSVSPLDKSFSWFRTVDETGVINVLPDRDANNVHLLNGVVYISSLETLIRDKDFYSPRTRALVMHDKCETLDIDTMIDWALAEAILQEKIS